MPDQDAPLTEEGRKELLAAMEAQWSEEGKRFQQQRDIIKQIGALLKQVDSLDLLDPVKVMWEERMKELAAAVLKPGTDEAINEFDGGLSALDYIWDLTGDRSWSSTQTEEPRWKYIEYFLGRRVEHVWGTGTVVKMPNGEFGIEIDLPCRCGAETQKVYAQPGCHNGAFCYIYDGEGNRLADLRNQELTCDRCGASHLDEPEEDE